MTTAAMAWRFNSRPMERILYLAHESEKTCLSVVDINHPANPVMVNQISLPVPGITRCNPLGFSGNVLVVANEFFSGGDGSAAKAYFHNIGGFRFDQAGDRSFVASLIFRRQIFRLALSQCLRVP
jgi:hypothetical protein